MTKPEIAYAISQERKRQGVHKPFGNCTPEEWDWQHAEMYVATGETRRPEVWIKAFIGG